MWPFDAILDAINGLFLFFISLIMLVAYGPVKIFEVCYNALVGQINLLIDLLNAFIGIYNVIVDGIFGLFEGVFFDSILNWIIVGQVFLILGYRVYHFVKDISIAGCKI